MLPRTIELSPIARRLVSRLLLAGGVAMIVALATRDCEGDREELTVVVDPGPSGDAIRGVRIDVAEGERSLGGTERIFAAGERRAPITLRTPPPAVQVEVTIELDTIGGPRRVRRTVAAAAGSTVAISIDAIDPPAPPPATP